MTPNTACNGAHTAICQGQHQAAGVLIVIMVILGIALAVGITCWIVHRRHLASMTPAERQQYYAKQSAQRAQQLAELRARRQASYQAAKAHKLALKQEAWDQGWRAHYATPWMHPGRPRGKRPT